MILELFLLGEEVGFDFFGEGDDGLPLFTNQFVGNYHTTLADRFTEFAKEMGLILEPQYVGGAAPKGAGLYRVSGPKGRVEFKTRIIKIYTDDETTLAVLKPVLAFFSNPRVFRSASRETFGSLPW